MRAFLFLFLLTGLLSPACAQQNSIFGTWKTIDDESGKPRSVVEIYKKDGKAYGVIKEIFLEPDEPKNPVCVECTDHRKDQPIEGMEVITGLERNGSEWSGGEILDPENGKKYRCKIWVEGGQLKVRGYLAFLYRTQTWIPVN
jgi:uncharacterized protein (DUF2147 family)